MHSLMKTITKGINMNDMKKIGLTALAGSLVAFSANAAEMTVSGATMLTYTSEDHTEVTGNPFGMKTNLAFTASGEVNGYMFLTCKHQKINLLVCHQLDYQLIWVIWEL